MQILSLLLILLTLSIIVSPIISLSNLVYADNLLVTSEEKNGFITIKFSNTTENDFNINMIHIWVGEDSNLQSFKTENGWSGKRISENTIIFTSTKSLSPGSSVNFDIKLDHASIINWKIGSDNAQKFSGKIYPSTEIDFKQTNHSKSPIASSPKFRIIPTNPEPGSTIRILGEGFDRNQTYYIYIDNHNIRNFKTDNFGNFVTTIKIPITKSNDAMGLTISDNNKFKVNKTIIANNDVQNKKTLLNDIINETSINSNLEISGNANFNDIITIYIIDPTGSIATTSATYADINGEWHKKITIPKNGILGEWSIKVINGNEIIEKKFIVISQHTIKINTMKSIYKSGETILLNVEATPNKDIEITVEDLHGSEVFSIMSHGNESGNSSIEIPTNDIFVNGTYSLVASQDDEQDILLIGIGETPKEKIMIKTNKINYDINSTASIDLYGPKSAVLSLIIIDQYDETKFSDSVTLESDGRSTYMLDLAEYAPGIYTIVAVRGNSQMAETFSVGLQLGSGQIELHTTKNKYKFGEQILILGNSSKNARIHLSMIDQNGNEVKAKEIFTDKNGIFSDSTFRIPTKADIGEWIIEARSGSNYTDKKINVIQNKETFSINLDDTSYSIDDVIMINGQNSSGTKPILMKIIDHNNIVIDQLEIFSTDEGEFSTPWRIPKYVNSGTYVIEASNQINVVKIIFAIE